MAPVERHSESSGGRPGSVGSRSSSEAPSRVRALTQGPWGKVVVKAAGIALLMLGLAGIGALAMAQGLATHATPVGEGSARRLAKPKGFATQASLAGGVPLAEPATTAASDAPGATPPAGPDSPRAAPPATSSAPEATPPTASGLTADGKVILNLANADELRKLPGVGQKRAEAILALRQKLGKFKRPADLLRIRGIGLKRLKQWLPKLVVDAPKESPAPAPSASSAPPASSAESPN